MSKVVCFGEIMLRLAPQGYTRFVQAPVFNAVYGGGEANVAISCANYGLDSVFVSKLPNNDLGQAAINDLRKFGVNTNYIVRGGSRIGIYFLEKGASQRASKVIYDRANSAISEADASEFDWEAIYKDAAWMHFTGITPAISKKAVETTKIALQEAKKRNITVSCDLNYRKNLWTTEEAKSAMQGLMQYVDVCIANEEDAEKVFGISASGTNISAGEISHEGYKEVAIKLKEQFGFSHVAITLRESLSADNNNWAAMLYDGNNFHFSKKYAIHIVDRVGGGDSFAGGLVYALVQKYSAQDAIEFATAASALKHTIEGDFNHAQLSEIKALMKGDGSGRVQR